MASTASILGNLPAGRVGRYELTGILGRGGMGTVYRGRDPVIGREVAIKLLERGGPQYQDQDLRRRFQVEARAVGRLSHPGVVTIFDVGEDTAGDFIAMELVEGSSLETVIRQGPVPFAKAVAIAVQVADALHHAHLQDVLHRDIKPANLMVTKAGHVKILDFGLAKVAVSAKTETGTILGTAFYLSPEYLSGEPPTARSDQFALGAVLFELLAGRRPFDAKDFAQVAVAIMHQEVPDLLDLVPGLPPRLVDVVERMLEKDPASRFPDCAQAAAALRAAGEVPGASQDAALLDDQALAMHLLEQGLVEPEAMEPAVNRAATFGQSLVHVLRDLRAISDAALLRAVGTFLGMDVLTDADARAVRLPPANLIPVDAQQAHGVFPLQQDRSRKQLDVAVPVERLNDVLPRVARLVPGLHLRPVLAFSQTIEGLRRRLLPCQEEGLPPAQGVKRRVLVVDARAEGQRAARDLGRLAGHVVTVARTLDEAAGLLSPGAFDVVLSSGLAPADDQELEQQVALHARGAEFTRHNLAGGLLGPALDPPAMVEVAEALVVAMAHRSGVDGAWLLALGRAHAQAVVAALGLLGAGPRATAKGSLLAFVAAVDRGLASKTQRPRFLVHTMADLDGMPEARLLLQLLAPSQAAPVVDVVAQVCAAAEKFRELRATAGTVGETVQRLRELVPAPLDGRAVEAVVEAMAAGSAAPAQDVLTVVVADGRRELAVHLAMRLRNHGVKVEVLHNGDDVIKRVEQGGVGLVLSDLVLPGRDGLALCLAVGDKVPVILWTERTGGADVARALKLGAADVLPKDVDDAVLLAKIERHLKVTA